MRKKFCFYHIRRVVPLLVAVLLFYGCCVATTVLGNQDVPVANIELVGAGALMPERVIQKAISMYESLKATSGKRVKYIPMGSGRGFCRMKGFHEHCDVANDDKGYENLDFALSQTVDAAPGAPFTVEPDSGLNRFPLMSGAVVPVYNIQGLSSKDKTLVFHKHTLSRIYRGHIKQWDDPEILEVNVELAPKLQALANKTINLFARADSSGTTETWKRALSHFEPTFFYTLGLANRSEPYWPGVENMNLRETSEEIVGGILTTPNSIGYLDLAQANFYHLKYAELIQSPSTDGSGVPESLAANYHTVSIAMREFSVHLPSEADPNELSLRPFPLFPVFYLLGNTNPNGWPICSYTYLIVRQGENNNVTCDRNIELYEFVDWLYTSEAFREIARASGFVRDIHPDVTKSVRKSVETALLHTTNCSSSPTLIKGGVNVLVESQFLQEAFDVPIAVLTDKLDAKFNLEVTETCYLNHTEDYDNHDIYFGLEEKRFKSSIFRQPGMNRSKEYNNLASNYIPSDGKVVTLPYGLLSFGFAYNIPGIHEEVVLTIKIGTDIMNKQITNWNDPRIVALNPGLANISHPIMVYISSDLLLCWDIMEREEVLQDKDSSQTMSGTGLLYYRAVQTGLINNMKLAELATERILVQNVDYSISLVMLEESAVFRQADEGYDGHHLNFAKMVPNNQAPIPIGTNVSAIDCFVHADSQALQMPHAVACKMAFVFVVNMYIRKEFDVVNGVQVSTNTPGYCKKAETVVQVAKDLILDDLVHFVKGPSLYKFSEEFMDRNLVVLNSISCANKSVACPNNYNSDSGLCMPECNSEFWYATYGTCNAWLKRKATLSWIGQEKACAGGESLPDDFYINCDYIPLWSYLGMGLAGLSFVLIIYHLGLLALLYTYRNNNYVLAGQPIFNALLCVGNILCLCFLPISLGRGHYVKECNLRFWFLSAGFTMSCTALTLKVYRIWSIFSNKTLIPKKTTAKDVMPFFIAIMALDTIAFFISYLINDWQSYQKHAVEYPHGVVVVEDLCGTMRPELQTYSFVSKSALMVAALGFSWKTKRVTTLFSESKLISIVLYNTVLITVLCLVFLKFGTSLKSEYVTLLYSFAIVVCTAFSSAFLIVSRLLKATGLMSSLQVKRVDNIFQTEWSSKAIDSCQPDHSGDSKSSGNNSSSKRISHDDENILDDALREEAENELVGGDAAAHQSIHVEVK